jgi:Arc-like DNA binding domain
VVRKTQQPRIVMTRIPEGLHAFLRREAKLNARSVNAEIVHRLTQSMVQKELVAEIEAATERAIERHWERLTPAERRAAKLDAERAGAEAVARDLPKEGERE